MTLRESEEDRLWKSLPSFMKAFGRHNVTSFGMAKAGYNESEPRDERGQWAKLWASYPRLDQYPTKDNEKTSPDQQLIWEHLGGHIRTNRDNGTFKNSCAIRVSEALNQSGDPVPYTPGKTVSGAADANGKKNWYFYRVNDLKDYLMRTRRAPEVYAPSEWKTSLAGRKGILMFEVHEWDDAAGHFTLFDGKKRIDQGNKNAHDYTDNASRMLFWPVK